jgi:hypothetical protein
VPRVFERERRRVIARILAGVRTWRFGSQRGASRVTLPLVFERG